MFNVSIARHICPAVAVFVIILAQCALEPNHLIYEWMLHKPDCTALPPYCAQLVPLFQLRRTSNSTRFGQHVPMPVSCVSN